MALVYLIGQKRSNVFAHSLKLMLQKHDLALIGKEGWGKEIKILVKTCAGTLNTGLSWIKRYY
ncbi:hypothetical protein [Pediococcus acidilactici]|uniref:Uncharacterized protein n=1 Tax=Pediococcus acidilactici DSM 20284 TaxID=862514 RepID=E0NI35_PEDAC|nr:hypothetical protein HMPREF0623_1666 [Pediococcus acidilactici DSM 20284]